MSRLLLCLLAGAFMVSAKPDIENSTDLPDGKVGSLYHQQIKVDGGQPPYTFAVTSGAMPPTVTVVAGMITGIPTVAGDYEFRVQVTDTKNESGQKKFRLHIAPVVGTPLSITTSGLPPATAGQTYSATLQAGGGTQPYTWSVTSGSLPPGLTMNPSVGTISGNASGQGNFDFTVLVRDGPGATATRPFSIVVTPGATVITTGNLPQAQVGQAYSTTLQASGGTPPYNWTIASGALPAGLNLSSSGTIGGTPSSAGSFDFSVRANNSAPKAFSIVVTPGATVITTGNLPQGEVGQAYSTTLQASGGTPPYNWTISSGTLPAGLSLSSSGTIGGTPSAPGSFDFSVRANNSAPKAFSVVVTPGATVITTGNLPQGQVGQAYSATLQASGGTPPYNWTIASGALPGGLLLSSSGTISGTPSSAGSFDFSLRADDSAPKAFGIVVSAAEPPPVNITSSSVLTGTVGQSFSATLSASGGTPPYTWSLAGGTLPPGVNLADSGIVSGNPTAAGDYDFTVRAADSANRLAVRAVRMTINAAPATPITITSAGLASGTVGQPYNQTLTATGGTPPYTWSITSGTLPAGLTLNAGGNISGTPTAAGEANFTLQAADTANRTGSRALRITIATAAAPLSITTQGLAPATVGQSYSQTVSASGGRPPYQWSVSSGTLPAGVTLSAAGALAGTPTTGGDFDFTVRAADSASGSATRQLRISVAPGDAPLNITSATLPGGNTGSAYLHSFSATGGRVPYTWSVIAGSVPPGLRVDASSGQLAGTPLTGGQHLFTVRVTDSAARSADRAFNVQIAAGLAIAACPSPTARTGVPYNANLTAAGGVPPYQWSVASGQLPSGTTLNPFSGALSGTPTTAGPFTFVLNVADSANGTASQSCTINAGSSLEIQPATVPDATTLAPYSATLQAAGGAAPYRWSTSAGSLPPGLALDERTGAIAGQAAQPGRFTFTVVVADASGERAQRAYALSVVAGLTIPACPLPVATAGQQYTSAIGAVGGQAPYTWSVTSGSLPQGLSFTSDSLSGVPANAGTNEFTIGVSDANGGSATRACTITAAPQLRILTAAVENAKLSASYRQALSAEGGTAPYVWSLANGNLPPGLTMNSATGEVIGVPSLAGTSRLTVRVTDAAGVRAEQSYEILVTAGLLISACPQASAVAQEPYSSVLTLVGADGAAKWEVTSGSLPAGMTLVSESGVIAGVPETTGSSEFTITAVDGKPDSAARTCSISVVPAALRVIGPDTLSDAVLGATYEAAIAAAGGRQPYRWTLAQGTVPPGLTVDPDGVLRGTPAGVGSYRFTVRVEDEDKSAGTRSFDIRVVAARAPLATFADLPEILAPAQQPRIRLALDSAYPSQLRGRVTLRFRPDPGLADDPSIRFVTGDRFADFQVAPDATDCVFSLPQMAMQTGSVAGTIELSVRLWSGDTEVTPSSMPVRTVRIDRTAPVITNVRLNPVANGIEIVVTGISTTREVTGATFQFTAAPGSRLDPSQITVDTSAASRLWFSDSRSVEFGGQFTFVQPFTVTGATLREVSVTLTNGQGTSQPSLVRP